MMPPGLLPFGPNPFLMQQLAAASGLRQNFHQHQQRAGLLGPFSNQKTIAHNLYCQ
jgi:hypothetical protein